MTSQDVSDKSVDITEKNPSRPQGRNRMDD